MDQRCSKNCRSADSCGHSRYALHFHIRILLSDFKHQSAHTIDSGISAADHSRCLSFFCLFKSHTATLYFLFHRCRQELFSCKMLPHQIYINGISDNDITGFQCFYRTDRHLFIFPRSNSNYIYFFHVLYSSISFCIPYVSNSATVTPFPACFLQIHFGFFLSCSSSAATAARSQTFPTPVVCFTKSDNAYAPGICKSVSAENVTNGTFHVSAS